MSTSTDNKSDSVLQETVMDNIDSRLTRFWHAYSTEIGDYDEDILHKNASNIKGVMLFAGLFSAVAATFLVSMQSNLQPDPADTTNALLMMLVQANNNSVFADQNISLPVWNGPSYAVVCSQALGYAALSISLFAAVGAVLGQQWLTHYTRLRTGELWERCRRRQQELESLKTWRFEAVIGALPALIQLALLLFSIALAIMLWEVNRVIGAVLIASTAIGVFLYSFITLASLFFSRCPFQTPVSSSIRGVVGAVMKSTEEVTEYWAWCTDLHNRLTRPIISRGNKYIGGVLFYPLLVAVIALRLVLLAAIGPRVVLVAWLRGRRGDFFQAEMLRYYRLAFRFESLKSRFHSFAYWVYGGTRRARSYMRRTFIDPELDLGASDPYTIVWVLENSNNPESLMAAAELVPDVTWPRNLDLSLPTEHLCSIFIRSLHEKFDGRALRLGQAFIVMLCQVSKEVSTHIWEEALGRITQELKMLDDDDDVDLHFILVLIAKLLRLKLDRSDYGADFPANCEVSRPLLSFLLQELETLLQLEPLHQSRFHPEAYRVFLKLEWPEESQLDGSQGLQYLRTFEIYFNSVVGADVERMEDPVKPSPQELGKFYINSLQRILEKLRHVDHSQLPEVHQHLIVPLSVLSRLASVSYMQQAFRNTDISLWMIKAFKEAVGTANQGKESIWLFTHCIMKLATVIGAFNPTDAQVERSVTNGDIHEQPSIPPVRMDSKSLLSFLLNEDRPATSEQAVYALKIMLINVDELSELASNPEFVNYILFATDPEQVYPVQDIGSEVLVAACEHLILARDAPRLARLTTQCDLVRFLHRGILHQDPSMILRDLIHNEDENFNAGLLKILAPALGDPFNTLVAKLSGEPNKIPESDLRDLEIALVLSNIEGRKRLLYDHLDRCIAMMPLWDYKYTMALPLVTIVGWLLRRNRPLSATRDEGIWQSPLRPNFEELLFPAWGDVDTLEENPRLLRLLLNCTARLVSTFGRTEGSGVPSGSQPSLLTLRKLDGAVDQLSSASQRLSSDIKRALPRLSREIKQYLSKVE